MSGAAQRYPLSWPVGWRRTAAGRRERARFAQTREEQSADGSRTWRRTSEVSVATAVGRLQVELDRLRATEEVLSTNIVLRLDGKPRSDQSEPADPGVAVYFRLKGKPRVFACDKWTRVADNIAAVAAHIHAIRAVERYGIGTLEQAFAGYAALPSGVPNWWDVLGFEPSAMVTIEDVEKAYLRLAQLCHPDAGGTHEAMARLNAAREAAREALR